MHRFFVETAIEAVGQKVTLSKEESVHATRVLRLKPGETVQLLDGEALYAGEIEMASEQGVSVSVNERLPSVEPSVRVTLFQGLPKADKLEWIIQKATELGVWEVVPMEMARCVAKADRAEKREKKRERYQRISLEAAKQSGRAHVPNIKEPKSFGSVCQELEKSPSCFDAVFVAWEEEQALSFSKAVQAWQKTMAEPLERVALVIGPEGGISPEECVQLKKGGAISVTLGKRILRTETAGLCALSVLWAALGEM